MSVDKFSTHIPFLLALCALACGAAPSPATRTPTPASSVETGPRAILPSGAVYRLEIARTPEQQAQGLMFRESLPPRYGMLFPFPEGGVHGFWMKNTMIPLDILWMNAEGRVIFVSANTPPCQADPCPSYGPDAPAASVLEIAGGMAAEEKIAVGSIVRLLDVGAP